MLRSLMTKPGLIIYWTLISAIISYPLLLLMDTSLSEYYYYHAYGQATDTANDNPLLTIDGIECARTEQFAFHIHTQFNITINNQSYPIPAGIGIIPNNCIYWLHTHDDSGVIHIESPVEKKFTLGHFLRIWNEFNGSDVVVKNLIDNTINGTLTVYVDGMQMGTNSSDYRGLALKDQSYISLKIGE